jgi:hypothetical protein
MYDENDDGPSREREKRFSHSFLQVAWVFVFVYLIGTLAFCARWVLAYTSVHDDLPVPDANLIISQWLFVAAMGVVLAFLVSEPMVQLLRFGLIPACIRRFGKVNKFSGKGFRVVPGPFEDAHDPDEEDMKKHVDQGQLFSALHDGALSSVGGQLNNFNQSFTRKTKKTQQGESKSDYVGTNVFDLVAEFIEMAA